MGRSADTRRGGRALLHEKLSVLVCPPRQSASVTWTGPSVVTWSAALQSTLARLASIVKPETLVAVIVSASAAASEGAAPHALDWLVYGIAGILPPVSAPAPCVVSPAGASPFPKPAERTSTVPSGAVPLPSRSVTP